MAENWQQKEKKVKIDEKKELNFLSLTNIYDDRRLTN